MIRTAACSLRRGTIEAAQGEQRRLASHPPSLLQRPASSPPPCRGFHGGAISGSLLRPAVPPSPDVPSLSAMARHLTISRHSRMYTTSNNPLEETKKALLQNTVAARKRKQEEETKEKIAEAEAQAAEKKAKADELLALISRQAASGVVQDRDVLLQATLLARSERDGQQIDKLKEKLELVEARQVAGPSDMFC